MRLPLIFTPQNGEAVYVGHQSAEKLWKDRDMTLEEIEHVLSMTFVDVRLKHYLEIRGADSMPFVYVMGYLALIKGIFYYEDALEQILSRKISEADILQAEENLMELGFEGDIYGEKADVYLKNIFAIAREHLEGNEKSFLDVLEQIVEEKRSLTDYYEK